MPTPRRFFLLLRSVLFIAPIVVALGALPAQTAEGPNLVPNGSLESQEGAAPASWFRGRWGTNSAEFRYPASGADEGRAAEVVLTQRTSGDAKWYFQEVPIEGGVEYIYEDRYQSTVDTHVTVQYRMGDGTYSWVDIGMPPPAGAWKTFRTTFRTPPNAVAATVFHLINQVGSLRIDDVALVRLLPDPNLITNPSVEDQNGSVPRAWGKGRWGVNTTVFRYPVTGVSGGKAVEVEITQRTSGDAKWHYPEVPVAGGEGYTFSDRYMASVPTYVTIEFRRADGSKIWRDLAMPAAAATWTDFRQSFIAPPDAVSAVVYHLINRVGVLRTDAYALTQGFDPSQKFDQGFVSLHFDDGFKSTYQNAMPILARAGMKSTQYIITGAFARADYVNRAEMFDMASQGHEIGSHTRSHPDLTALSDEAKREEIVGSRQDLIELGIDPVETFAYPFGAYDAATTDIVKEAGYIGARSTEDGLNGKIADVFELKRRPIEANTTIEQVRAWIAEARSQKLWLILVFHRIQAGGGASAVTPELLQRIVDELKVQNVPVRTTAEGLRLMVR